MMPLYSLLLLAGLLVSSPWWLLRMLTTERYRDGMRERLGRVPRRLRAAAAGKRVVWVHAVSVGEVLAATRLVEELGAALGPEGLVVISTTTRTGQRLARERFGAERVFYLPLDFAAAVRRYLRVLRPSAMVLMESEVWPRLLHECRRKAVPVCVVNARVSDRSLRRALAVRALWSRVLGGVSLWLAQSQEDAQRLMTLGARAATVHVTGNMKCDVRCSTESRAADLLRALAAGRRIVVGGSTLGETPAEEAPLIEAMQAFPEAARPLLVVAPRHPERFDAVYAVAAPYGAVRATALLRGEAPAARVDIVVLDTIGDLGAVYSLASLAFVGGSLVKRGGHNPLEPAQFGVPVVMGPSFENFRAIVNEMRWQDSICIVGEESADEISPRFVTGRLAAACTAQVVQVLNNPERAAALGERGRKVFEAQQGATVRTVEAIMALLADSGPVPR